MVFKIRVKIYNLELRILYDIFTYKKIQEQAFLFALKQKNKKILQFRIIKTIFKVNITFNLFVYKIFPKVNYA